MRDDFDEKIKDILARRVGFRCSNPKCRKLTSGPQINPAKSINIGVASHIAAASKGGKRYDINQTSEQRKSIDNGIWLCQSCSKLIDSDEIRYQVELLKQWKLEAEALALREIEGDFQDHSPTDPLEIFARLLDEPNDWVKVQDDRYIRHRYDVQYIIKEGETIDSDFQEPWTKKFPDNHASRYLVEYWQGTTLLKTSYFIVADGGRYTIPLPKLTNRNPQKEGWEYIEFSIDTNSLEWKTAMLFNQYDSLWKALPRVGVILKT